MYFLFLWWLLCLPHILLLLFSFFFFFFCMWLHAYLYICMHAYGPSVHVRVGLWMMTILWGCAGSCLNPQTHSTLRAGPCPWSHSMMRVRHTQLQTLKNSRHTLKKAAFPLTQLRFFSSNVAQIGYDPRTCKQGKNILRSISGLI